MLLELIPCNGARPNNRQVSVQDIDKLRHLVDRTFPNELTNLGNARIIVNLALNFPLMKLLRAQILLHVASIGDHATKLKNLYRLSALANALLRVHRAAGRFEANEHAHNGDRDKQQYAHQKTEHQIKQPLNKAIAKSTARFNLFNSQCVPHRYAPLSYFFSSHSQTYVPVPQGSPNR